MIELGARVRDVITGFEGIAVSRTESLFIGPDIRIQSEKLDNDGMPMEAIWFEESRVELVKPAAVVAPMEAAS